MLILFRLSKNKKFIFKCLCTWHPSPPSWRRWPSSLPPFSSLSSHCSTPPSARRSHLSSKPIIPSVKESQTLRRVGGSMLVTRIDLPNCFGLLESNNLTTPARHLSPVDREKSWTESPPQNFKGTRLLPKVWQKRIFILLGGETRWNRFGFPFSGSIDYWGWWQTMQKCTQRACTLNILNVMSSS